jgi:hypothetical protein
LLVWNRRSAPFVYIGDRRTMPVVYWQFVRLVEYDTMFA